jgi:hypothetical protein
MTNSQPQDKKPSPRQLRYLKDLAMKTGGSFSYPSSLDEADREIKRLLKRRRTPAAERRREKRDVQRDMAGRRGDDASVRADELVGYGSSATYR